MSLDLYFIQPGATKPSGSRIFVRENGENKEISRKEWNEKFPGREPIVVAEDCDSEYVFERNMTHNLGRMADDAGIYQCLWRPEELGITKAGQMRGRLLAGIARLENDPEHFKLLNPKNGWGDYDGLLAFAKAALEAACKYPDADIRVSR